ncbi:hypothetical protein [Oerskovia merdavium]|uniref:OCRE domain-containing protein n=1 Tax=Oerskovia merdavium TaxID=2762227 RepID=A0ABR8U4C8_9CELL|nr:hypothetical protein [Oerskovia merdavium]MBD7982899.1 hypothetical protein [Oerskovia merdavium]
MSQADKTLLEATGVRRERLAAALLHGPVTARRKVPSPVRRFAASVVVAAVAGVGCVGYSLVVHLLDERRQTQALDSLRAAIAANPATPAGMRVDEDSGYWRDEDGDLFDPRTGFPIDEDTGLAVDPQGRMVDVRTGWFADPATGHLTDPKTGTRVDPRTMSVLEDDQ